MDMKTARLVNVASTVAEIKDNLVGVAPVDLHELGIEPEVETCLGLQMAKQAAFAAVPGLEQSPLSR